MHRFSLRSNETEGAWNIQLPGKTLKSYNFLVYANLRVRMRELWAASFWIFLKDLALQRFSTPLYQ